MNRRHLAKSALLGGASALLSASNLTAQTTPQAGPQIDAREAGAKGDGRTDDTRALQAAIDTAAEKHSSVFLPPGVYLTRELHLRPAVALTGIPAWNYSQADGGSVLRLASADATCLLNLTDARGASIEGLALEGAHLGQNIHGIATQRTAYGPHEDGFRIERCQVARFTGAGVFLSHAWCFSVRHSMMAYNQGEASASAAGTASSSTTGSPETPAPVSRLAMKMLPSPSPPTASNGTAKRIFVTGGDGYQITGNFFDRAGTIGMAAPQSTAALHPDPITGNFIKRSGKLAKADSPDSSQILIDGSTALPAPVTTCNRDATTATKECGALATASSSDLQNCVVANNVLHEGALRQLLVDNGGHKEGVVIKDNPGCLLTSK